ncbi:general substrate transporter [Pseudomassariella vexata]|uniref:General substrate transporter n=1 Tax=Pseudomassariella vexata TaxID=1141098 RepID=A0A1Y2DS87_9PEZI|nr:general substrate transporter [Pseudomassariella vexata]ORY62127.1 general substrate transporter [Pseudomassariella vexata]
MMGGMNILPQYTEYFHLSTATKSLNTATFYIGGCMACCFWGWLTDKYGRRWGLFWAAVITIVAAVIQALSIHVAMFCAARVLIGFGTTASVITGPAYLAETLPWNQRAWGLALFDDFYYVGALVAAGTTYGSFKIAGTWSWRLPSLVQGLWGVACILLLPWMPESPRWLVDQGRGREALAVLAYVNANGDMRNDLVRLQFRQICDTIGYERDPMSTWEMLRNRGARKRLIITATCALFSMLTGNIFVSYNIGKILTRAGVTNAHTQLLVNVGLSAWTLVVSLCGSFYTDRMGVKSAALLSTGGLTVALFIIGILTRQYGESDYRPGIYATVAGIFFFSTSFGFGWIPILFLIPAEMLFFRIRATGMSMFSLVICATGIWSNFAFPVALERLGWKLYLINGGWNILFFAFIAWYWVEIKGKTIEEIDALFDGVKHSNMPDVEAVLLGIVNDDWKARIATWMKRFGYDR